MLVENKLTYYKDFITDENNDGETIAPFLCFRFLCIIDWNKWLFCDIFQIQPSWPAGLEPIIDEPIWL